MIRNQASQIVGAQMVSATTGAAFAGTVTVYVTIDGGTQAIGSVGSGLCTAEGNGYYTYAPSAAETNGYLVAFTFIGTGAIPATLQIATVTAAQQATLGAGSGGVALTARALLTEALEDITVLAPGDVLDDTEATRALAKLTRLFDNWNAERCGVYAVQQTAYTLVPSLSPQTIGPAASSPTFTATQRPVSIDAASIVIGSGTNAVYYELNLRDAEWYAGLPMPALSTSVPSDLYYAADWPLGSLYLWPVPSAAYGLVLQTRILLAALALDDIVSLPPGYRDAVTLTLGEMLAPTYPPAVADKEGAAKARARIFANNDVTPSLSTADYGTTAGKPSSFSYLRGF